MDLATAAIAAGSAIGASGLTGLFAWLSTRTKAPADMTASQAAFQTALSQQAEGFIKALQAEREALLADRQSLQAEVADLHRRVQELESDNLRCRGETAQMGQHIESLQVHLRRHGIDIPEAPRPRGFTVFEEGKATVFTLDTPPQPPARRRRRKAST